jgi:hypothetical protein
MVFMADVQLPAKLAMENDLKKEVEVAFAGKTYMTF